MPQLNDVLPKRPYKLIHPKDGSDFYLNLTVLEANEYSRRGFTVTRNEFRYNTTPVLANAPGSSA